MNVAEEETLLLTSSVKFIKTSMFPPANYLSGTQSFLICGSLGPFIVITSPTLDLCWTCQKNNNEIHKNCQIIYQRSKRLKLFGNTSGSRVSLGAIENFLKTVLTPAKRLTEHLGSIEFMEKLAQHSVDRTENYSYDHVQQIRNPSEPYQPGPIYLKTPRECSLFGVSCKAIPRQVNFLIHDETVLTGKGANTSISYVDYLFERHVLGETHAPIHAENC